MALSFPDPGAFREGLVVEFVSSTAERWIGNFALGHEGVSLIDEQFGRSATVVVAKGAGYLVDVDERMLISELSGDIEFVQRSPSGLLIFGNGIWFEAFDGLIRRWRTLRISWDGMRNITVDGARITGEAYTPVGPPDWLPFEVDLEGGEVRGGSYPAALGRESS
jgi:hypothetical protein